jgi:hypothetical protein
MGTLHQSYQYYTHNYYAQQQLLRIEQTTK